jgi:hypothetical protein
MKRAGGIWTAFLPTTKSGKSIADNVTAVGVFQRRSKSVERGCSATLSRCVNWWKESLPSPGVLCLAATFDWIKKDFKL